MPELWLPGAERVPGAQPGGDMVGGPPRATWHITWDKLDAAGNPPPFGAVRDYLVRAGFEPHLMWDPVTGRVAQFLPADRSAYALRHPPGTPETNRRGAVNVQVEVFFTPGVVRDGKRYATVADTPLVGYREVVDWLRSWGIPDAWPMGMPTWAGNRDAAVWAAHGGHYGHCHVPANDHTDPGPLPALPSSRPPKPAPHPDLPGGVVFTALYRSDGARGWILTTAEGRAYGVPPTDGSGAKWDVEKATGLTALYIPPALHDDIWKRGQQ